MTKKALKRRYPRIKPKVKKYWEGGTTGSFLDTETKAFNKKLDDYQKQSLGTANQLPSYLQSTQTPNLDTSVAPQYKSLAGNTKSNYGVDLSSYFNSGQGNSQGGGQSANTSKAYSTASYVGAAADIANQYITANQDPYTQAYGYQGSGVASTASSTNPIAGAASSVFTAVGNAVKPTANEYGYVENQNEARAYTGAAGGLDPYSQWETDVEEGDWWSLASGLLGNTIGTGILQSDQDQTAAKKEMDKAEREKTIGKIKSRNAKQSVLETQPTIMYPYGGTTTDPNKNIVDVYGRMHTTFSKDTNMVMGKSVAYDKPKYINSMPDTTSIKASLGNKDYSLESTNVYGLSDTDTNGVLIRRNVPYTDKRTGTVYNVPIVDTDIFSQYYPNAKKYPFGGMVQEPNAELEKGEPFRTPDGAIHKISDNAPTHAEGGVQLNLPEGTQILGKLEMYNKDKKFKEAGTKLKQLYDKYNKQLTENTSTVNKGSAELMLNKVQTKFSQLVAEQEAKAQAKQAKKYAKGGTVKKYYTGGIKGFNLGVEEPNLTFNPQYNFDSSYNPYDMGALELNTIQNPSLVDYPSINNTVANESKANYESRQARDKVMYDKYYPKERNGVQRTWDKYGNSETLSTVAQLAPAAYNIYQGIEGKTEKMTYSDYANPYRQAILNSIKNRKYNVEPELAANELAYQTGKRNIKQIAPSAGNLLSNYNALAGTRMRADGEALARKQNMENQYAGDRAQMLAQLGAQESGTKLSVAQYNKAAKAAKQGAMSTGIDQLAGAATNMQINKNLQKSDTMRFSAFDTAMRDVGIDINTKEGKATLKYIMDNISR